MDLDRMAEGSGDHRVFDAVTMRPDTEGVSEAVWPQPLTPGLVFSHQLLPVGQPPQDVPEGLPAHCLRECELLPVLHQIECGAIDGYRLKPPRFGLLFNATAGGEGLALDYAELRLAVVIVGSFDEFDFPGAHTKYPAYLHDVGPGLREQSDQLQHLGICEDGFLPALGISAPDLQVVLLGDQERLGLPVFGDGVFQKFLQCQAALQP